MPSELNRAYFALQDILHNIDLADEFLSGLTLETFQRDQRTIYAVVRCLEIISEAASKRVSPEVKARHPEIEWPHIAAAGNLYRHLYEEVDPRFVWNTVKDALPDLRAAVSAELGLEQPE
jgi:uncharacterized protein with HEPN domain